MTNFLAKLSAFLIWLSGKKTYAICLLTIAGCRFQFIAATCYDLIAARLPI
jgi:hypothetical protein